MLLVNRMVNIRGGREGLEVLIMSSVLNILSLKCLAGNLSGDLWVRYQRDIWVCIEGLGVIITDMAVKAKD